MRIPDGMTFAVDSDLNANGASPQFTLTCISTGGPATTVTWTRDFVDVTDGKETVLDNRVTSQYTHTLTVTGRLGGLYTCTVTNNRPSSASASYTVPGTNDMVVLYYSYVVCSSYISSLYVWIILYTYSLYCVPDVYLTLNGDYIPNHGYVNISEIGDALICNTNNVTTHMLNGDWFAPDGTIVGDLGSDNVPGFDRDRLPMKVRLHRNTSTDPPSEGIYYCVVEDDTFTVPTVYVGLYNSGGGILDVPLIAHTNFSEIISTRTIKNHRLQLSRYLRDSPGFFEFVPGPGETYSLSRKLAYSALLTYAP